MMCTCLSSLFRTVNTLKTNHNKDGILRKAESIRKKEPWTITAVHTNGTIRIQSGTKSERINIRRVTPFSEEILIYLGKNNIYEKNVTSISNKIYLLLSTNLTLRLYYTKIIVRLYLHLKQYLSIMWVIFYLKPKVFLHDFTLMASVVGESVMGHGMQKSYPI